MQLEWGQQTSQFSTDIWHRCVLSTVRLLSVTHTAVPGCGKLVTLIIGKRRRLLFTGDGQQSVYDKKRQRYAEDNRTAYAYAVVNLKPK